MDITRCSTLKSDWLYSLQPKWRSSIESAKTRLGADCGSEHELLVAKFRLKLQKVGKTTRPFKYNLNQFIYILLIISWVFDLDYIELIWRRKWQPTPEPLPGKPHGRRSLVGYSLWGHRAGHDWLHFRFHFHIELMGEGGHNWHLDKSGMWNIFDTFNVKYLSIYLVLWFLHQSFYHFPHVDLYVSW